MIAHGGVGGAPGFDPGRQDGVARGSRAADGDLPSSPAEPAYDGRRREQDGPLTPIGHAVVPCPGCGQTRRVPVAATLHTVQVPGSWRLRMLLGDEQLGVSYVSMRAQPDGHVCPGRTKLRRVA